MNLMQGHLVVPSHLTLQPFTQAKITEHSTRKKEAYPKRKTMIEERKHGNNCDDDVDEPIRMVSDEQSGVS